MPIPSPRHPRHAPIGTGPRADRITRRLLTALAALGPLGLAAQTTFSESFTGTTAAGWVFGGNYTPTLTATAGDAPGDGWLRLTDNANNRATYALLDTQIFSVNAKIQIELDYTFYNGTGGGADGITFFLIDGSVTAATFATGSYGGSLGYAQRTGTDAGPGMVGGYLGFGFDNFGNYSNPTEGRVGGTGSVPNAIAVRGPESSNWAYIDGSGPLQNLPGGGQMDFPGSTTRPDQSGADFRSFRLTLDADNFLTVEMRFGLTSDYITAFTTDLSAFDRPETFKIGFTGATGGSTEIHEVRNVVVTSFATNTPGISNYEWDNDGGANKLVATGNNWVGNNAPATHGDLLFRNASPNTSQTVEFGSAYTARSLNFESTRNHTLTGSAITLGDGIVGNDAAINVAQSGSAIVHHRIANNLNLAETTRITNLGNAILCLNGIYSTGTHTTHLAGSGSINFNGTITGSGAIIKGGSGITTINGNNTGWSGPLTINQGVVAITQANALGDTGSGSATTINSGGALFLRGGTTAVPLTTAEPLRIAGTGVTLRGGGQSGALHADGGAGSSFTVTGPVTLTANAAIGGRAGSTLTINGAIGQSGTGRALTKVGDGLVVFGADNTYTGATIIAGGALRVSNANQIDGSNLTLNGGVLELSTGFTSFTRGLGNGTTQVQWTGSGGFSASGSDATVNIGGGTNLTWASTANFLGAGQALLLSSDYANRTLTFQNNINLGGQVREVRVANGSAAVDGTLSGALTGNVGNTGGLLKTGAGTLSLSGTNTYTGATIIREGALRGSPGTGSNIQLDGGVRELGANYTTDLGTTGGLIRWTSGGGLAADTTARTFNVGGDAQTLIWAGTTGNSAHFVRDGGELVLGSVSSSATLTFSNAINLNGAQRTIRAVNSTASAALREANITGAITGGDLVIAGNGNLGLTANSNLGATSTVTIRGAQVTLEGNNGAMTAAGFVVTQGGSLVLNNASDLNTDRITGNLTLKGGTLSAVGRSQNGAMMNETIGTVVLGSGSANTINITRSNNNGSTRNRISATSLTREAGSTVNFTTSAGTLGGGVTTANPTITFGTAPDLVGGVLAYATVNSTSFAGYNATNGVTVAAFSGGINDTTARVLSVGTGTSTLTANRAHNALRLFDNNDTNDSNLNLGGFTLTLNSGGLISTRDTTGRAHSTNTLSNGTLVTAGDRELITHVTNASSLNISANIGATGNTSFGLTKSGDGTLTLSGTTANTYTGTTTVNDGTLVLAKSANTTAVAGDLVVGDGRGTDTVRITANEQIADTATVTLRGGELGNATNVARLVFNDNSGSITESFATLHIEGNTVLDFAGGNPCAPTFLFLDFLTGDGLLTIVNWIEFTDYLLVKKDNFAEGVNLPRIVFDGYPGTYRWQSYDAQYFQITPVPEPASYGILSLGGLIGLVATRRRRRQM